MDAQQLLDHIIKPTLKFMGGGYDSKNARMLKLSTSAVESNCGKYIKQINGPALGPWQMEPFTHDDIWCNCDFLRKPANVRLMNSMQVELDKDHEDSYNLMVSPMYSCAMARLKYAMDPVPLPKNDYIEDIYDYYKRIYNTPEGASTYRKFTDAWIANGLHRIKL